MKEMLTTLFNYNYWANGKILAKAEQATEAQFNAQTNLGHNTLRATLFHMLRTEWLWRTLAQEYGLRVPPPQLDDFRTLVSIQERWRAEEKQMRAFLNTLNDKELKSVLPIRDREGNVSPMTLWHMLTHLLMHSMQHRTEVAAILTEYGQSPGDLDFIFFVSENKPKQQGT